ncbi:helix-turn-helix transcriptional regulator [Brevundimonas sp.]|uniref:helix-turn-helix transcriptional regulator n=1 Tax=Brevundimonas sp. TaxID=1871086 RepID=UPI0019A79948|nr:helix-turn-helix transcriptional regulator [Brevundimonas sp.]MBD3836035.1 helix-turn-helix transcriptional regulator [Brevundimonas sp.]
MVDARLSVRLKAARTAAGLTQAELAERTRLSRKTINTVENGVFTPSVVVALSLARALGTTVEALFGLDD